VEPLTSASSVRRESRCPDGLYIDEPAALPQATRAQPDEEADLELCAALAASLEVNDLEELAKWSHLAEVLSASALEEEARKAKEDADAWAFLAMAHRQEEAMRQVAL
jgi:hypothetical protein